MDTILNKSKLLLSQGGTSPPACIVSTTMLLMQRTGPWLRPIVDRDIKTWQLLTTWSK